MSKPIIEKAIPIHSLEEFNCIRYNYSQKQLYIFFCEDCGKEVKTAGYNLKVKKYFTCSPCANKRTCLKKYDTTNPMKVKSIAAKCNSWMKDEKKIKERSQKTKQTCLEKYGVTNPTYIPDHNEKVQETCLKKYGVKNPAQSSQSKEKHRQTWINKNEEEKQNIQHKITQTNLEKYGVEWGLQLKEVQEKSKKTCLEKYGVENVFQNKDVQIKYEQTMLKKHGVTNPNYIPGHDKKVKQTCIKKYGVENPMQSPQIKEKVKQTCLEKYGFEHSTQSPFIKEKIQQTNLEKYGFLYPAQAEKIKLKAKQTLFDKYGMYHAPKKKYTYRNESFDSSWELAVWIWALENGKKIKREPVYFEYSFGDESHVYYPDFLIEDKLIEVKGPQFFKKDGTMQNPYDHSLDNIQEAKHQCGLQHGVEFWGEKEMKPILEYVENVHGKDYLKKLKNYSN